MTESLETPVYELDLTVRAINCLEREGIDTVEKLCERSWPELKDIRGFGSGSIDDVISELAKRGLELRSP